MYKVSIPSRRKWVGRARPAGGRGNHGRAAGRWRGIFNFSTFPLSFFLFLFRRFFFLENNLNVPPQKRYAQKKQAEARAKEQQ